MGRILLLTSVLSFLFVVSSVQAEAPLAAYSSNYRQLGLTRPFVSPYLPVAKQVAALVTKLKDNRDAIRTNAASMLGDYGKRAKAALPALVYALKNDRSKWVRRASVKSLEKIAGSASEPYLRYALGDRNKWVAHSARNALRRVAGPRAAAPRRRLPVREKAVFYTARGNKVTVK